MSGINMSKTTTTTTGVNDVVAPAPRLIDLDSNVTTYLKRVFVFGDPGSGTECATAWLQQMGYKVYDIAEAAKNHERDFPLWLEAVQLQQAGKPYNQSDYDKFLGKYHAVVGMPATFCAEEFIKAYPYAKFIVITKHPDPLVYADYYTYVRSAFLSFVDPDFFGLFSTFLKTIKTDVLDQQMVRSSIRNPNHLLEVESLDCKTMCNFLDMPMPKEPVADKFEDAALGVFKDRCQEITSRVGANIVNGLNYCAMAMSVAVAASFYASYTDTDVHLGSTIAVAIMLLLAIRSVMSTKPEPEPVVVASPPAVVTKAIGASPPVVAQPIQHDRWQQGRNQQGRNQQGRNQQGRNQQGRNQQGRNQKGHGQQPRGRRAPHNRNKSTSSSESKGSSNTVWTVASATTGASSVKPDSRPTTPPRPTPFVAKRSPLRNATVYPADSHISTPTGAKVVTPVAAKVTTPTVKVVTPSTAKVVTPAAKVITPAAKVVTPATATVVTPSAAKVAAPITKDAIKPVAAPTATPAAAPVSVRQRPAMTGAWAADSFYSAIRNRDTTKFAETIAKNEAMKDVKVEFITNYKPRRPRV